MNSLRISIVQYLNTAPLVRGFTHGALRGKYHLSFTIPSQCAEALRAGVADIAIIPSIELQRIDGLVVVPNLSIASRKSVGSLLLVAKKPLHEIRRIALDRGSRSTQALVRILCAKRWQIGPEFFEADPDLPSMLQQADAALLIGDPALRLAFAAERSGKRGASGTLTCSGGSAGVPGVPQIFVHDIVEEWRGLTNLAAVLAVWAGKREAVTPEVVLDFQQSLAFGLRHLDAIAAEAAKEMNLPVSDLRRYLNENIDYTLDEENLRGLSRYYSLAAELGLIPERKEIVLAAEPGGSARDQDYAAARKS
ncbi:MAG: menaquinone biosynthesis protein [Candidatus Acidiferrum sp.]